MATLVDGFLSSNSAPPGHPSSSKLSFDPHPSFRFSRNSVNVVCRMHFTAVSAACSRPQGQFAPIAKSTDRNDVGFNFPVARNLALCNRNVEVVKFNAHRVESLIGNKLEKFYAEDVKCVDSDRKVFDEIPERTLPTYAALIRAYCRSEKWTDLFAAFRSMVDEGILPDKYLVPTILKACFRRQLVKIGKMVHGYVIRKRMVSDIFIGNALMGFYGNCGDLRFSMNVFDSMSEESVVSWTALKYGVLLHGTPYLSILIFHEAELHILNYLMVKSIFKYRN